MAFESSRGAWIPALVALFGAIMIQVGTNFANDYFDWKKGADAQDRLGPLRVTQAGLVKPETMKRAVAVAFSLAGAAGVFLTWHAGWPIAVIGVLSILSGIFYTAGPYPLGYVGLGDLFVLIFFCVDLLRTSGCGWNLLRTDIEHKLSSLVGWFGSRPFFLGDSYHKQPSRY
jgi:1,4-dihydroxy-2-naphthoate octaprenyltransferase